MKQPNAGRPSRMLTLAIPMVLLGLVGCKKDTSSSGDTAPGAAAASASAQSGPKGAAVEVHITASKKGFQPALARLKKGRPGVLIFERIDDTECANSVKLPFLKENVDLPRGKKVRVEVPTTEDGTFRYSCWMRMLFGRVVIDP